MAWDYTQEQSIRMLEEINDILINFFDKNKEKIDLWYETPNPMIGGISPWEMIQIGRQDKLLKIMKESKSLNDCVAPE